MLEFYDLPLLKDKIYNEKVELLPSVTELFELEMANLEFQIVKPEQHYERLSYFQSINGKTTRHYEMLKDANENLQEGRSTLTKKYFQSGNFSTGYCTHGLFPYRGKFHPQLIKAIMNIIGIEPGDTIIDPMCGSGTANIEAAINGINSLALDLSPFCRFMTKVKYESLTIDNQLLAQAYDKKEKLFAFFLENRLKLKQKFLEIGDSEKLKVYELSLLAFFDSMGYSIRVKTSSHEQLFYKVLKRYIETLKDYLENKKPFVNHLGKLRILEGSALKIPLENETVDAVITSPPYSFAIDYLENDKIQLEFLDYNIEEIRTEMIGLRGKSKKDKLENYFIDMNLVCREVSRILKPNKYFVMIIGSNTNQTGGIRLEQNIIDSCKEYHLELKKTIIKPIKGMRNTMKEEYILFFKKEEL